MFWSNKCVKVNDILRIYLSGCNAVQSGENQQTFRRNISPPSSGSKQEIITKQTAIMPACSLLTLWPRRLRRHFPPKHKLNFTWLHGVIFQNVEFFIGNRCENLKSGNAVSSFIEIFNIYSLCLQRFSVSNQHVPPFRDQVFVVFMAQTR
jgi:hypothetical protein